MMLGMATDLSDDIATQAVEPVSVSADGQSSTRAPIGDMKLADQYLAAKASRNRGLRGIGVTRLITPGTLDDTGRNPLANFDTPGGYQ